MKKSPFALLLCLSLFCARTTAQTVAPQLDSLLTHALDSMHNVLGNVGMGAAVHLPNGAIWSGGTGISAENPDEPITPEYIFNIGSITKTLTSACILHMADEGLLSLDDSLHEWLDTFNYINPNITIRQLLRHQTGIYNFVASPQFQPAINADPDSVWAMADVIKTFVQAPLFQPGAAFSYSNTNYLLLGMIIETISGKPYYEAIRERFLDPLALTSFNIPPYEPFPQPVAHLWLDLDDDNILDDAHIYFSDWPSWYSAAGPAGAYFASPAHLARWMYLLMRGDLLAPATMAQMKTTVTTPFNGGTRYGLGVMERNIGGLKGYGHGGDAGYSASAWYFPDKDISISVLNNDGSKNSWTLIPTVTALLKTYSDYENLVSGSEDLSASAASVKVFPNPFSERATLSAILPTGAKQLRVVMTDVSGRSVAEEVFEAGAGNGTFTLEHLNELPGGTYLLHTTVDGQSLPGQQLVIKR